MCYGISEVVVNVISFLREVNVIDVENLMMDIFFSRLFRKDFFCNLVCGIVYIFEERYIIEMGGLFDLSILNGSFMLKVCGGNVIDKCVFIEYSVIIVFDGEYLEVLGCFFGYDLDMNDN